jgi:hypothetical protein
LLSLKRAEEEAVAEGWAAEAGVVVSAAADEGWAAEAGVVASLAEEEVV